MEWHDWLLWAVNVALVAVAALIGVWVWYF